MRVAQAFQALLCAAVLALPSTSAFGQQQNEIFGNLMQNGVTLSDGTKAKLPEPVMADGLSADAQQKVIANLVPPARLASFRAGNLNDWFELKISGAPAAGPGLVSARNVDLYYIANARLETVANKNFIKQAMGGGGGAFHILTDAELNDEKIEVTKDTPTKRERYAHAKLDLFNMAKVEGTGRGISTQQKDSVLIAFKLDPRFEGHPKFPNQWQAITLDAAGVKVLSPPQSYKGTGGYMKVTRVAGSANPQIFIEYHLVFEEPFGWFNGKSVLTSKLPDKVRADVRSFRRDLKKFEQENPPQPAGAQGNAGAAAAQKAGNAGKDKDTEAVSAAAKSSSKK